MLADEAPRAQDDDHVAEDPRGDLAVLAVRRVLVVFGQVLQLIEHRLASGVGRVVGAHRVGGRDPRTGALRPRCCPAPISVEPQTHPGARRGEKMKLSERHAAIGRLVNEPR